MDGFRILLDSPADQPALGFGQTAAALREIIEGSKPQFVVGIFGSWGSGKTTLMRAIRKQLNPAKSIAVEFSAWRYEKEPSLVVPLLDVLREALLELKSANQPVREKAVATASTIGKAMYSLLAGLSFKVGVPDSIELSFKANEALSQAQKFAEEEKAAHVPRSFYHAAFQSLRAAFRDFLGAAGGPDRIVVFVDDLDRCLPQGALEVLEAMKLFFDLEGFVFVVGLDRRVVERSIDVKYGAPAAAGASEQEQIRGADYIKKIFQVPFTVAPVAVSQLDEFLYAAFQESDLPPAQTQDFHQNVTPHLRYLLVESGVNPREVKRYLNAYTLVMKVKPHLQRGVVLALQTIAFRRDWQSVSEALLSYRALFLDALVSRIRDRHERALTDLDEHLNAIPESFIEYVTEPNPGAPLLQAANVLDEHLYSGEATRSSMGPMFFDAIRDVAKLRRLLGNENTFAEYRTSAPVTLNSVINVGGPRLQALVREWKEQPLQADDTNFAPVQDAFLRRVLSQLIDQYRLGSIAAGASAA